MTSQNKCEKPWSEIFNIEAEPNQSIEMGGQFTGTVFMTFAETKEEAEGYFKSEFENEMSDFDLVSWPMVIPRGVEATQHEIAPSVFMLEIPPQLDLVGLSVGPRTGINLTKRQFRMCFGRREREEAASEAFFVALGEMFASPTEEQRIKAGLALEELLAGWLISRT